MTLYYSDIDTLLFLARTTARRLKERFAPGGVARVVSPEFVNRPARPARDVGFTAAASLLRLLHTRLAPGAKE